MAKLLFVQKRLVEYLGIHSLAAFLKAKGHRCDVLCFDGEKNFYDEVIRYNPDIIASSLMVGAYKETEILLKQIKRVFPDKKIIVGGSLLTIFPDIIKEKFIDMTIIGDGEYPLVKIMDKIDKNNFDFSDIEGTSFKKGKRIIRNTKPSFVQDLTVLPSPDRDIYYQKYQFLRELQTKPFILSRGCPFNCSYCYSAQFNNYFKKCGSYWRLKDSLNVIKEIKSVKEKYGLKWVQFHDGTFNANIVFIKKFLKLYAKNKLPRFMINSRTENIDEEYVYLLKKAGCDKVTIGVQHGNEEFRRAIAGRPMSNHQIIKSCQLLKKNKIRISIDIIFGWPGETLKLAWETINFVEKLHAEVINANILRFYPSTTIFKYTAKKKLINPKITINKIESLNPNNSQLKQKNIKELINLDKLYYLAIKYPKLQWLVKLLSKLPPNKIFLIIQEIPFIKRDFQYEIKSYRKRLFYLINYFKKILKI